MTCTKMIGKTWKDSKGRTWEVIEYLYFGRMLVRTTDKRFVGEMQAQAIKKLLAIPSQGTSHGIA